MLFPLWLENIVVAVQQWFPTILLGGSALFLWWRWPRQALTLPGFRASVAEWSLPEARNSGIVALLVGWGSNGLEVQRAKIMGGFGRPLFCAPAPLDRRSRPSRSRLRPALPPRFEAHRPGNRSRRPDRD